MSRRAKREARRFTVREHAAWLDAGRPTDPAAVEALLDRLAFDNEPLETPEAALGHGKEAAR